ncbi:hypothetical protein BYT27DRAFT_7260193 [Phlegmacium glaucopus]|nr:hypothetical protein BYT27DRAFT_7260193 [Phlegmacium glaucopus]
MSSVGCLEAGQPYPCSSCVKFDKNLTLTITTTTTTTILPKDHTPTVALLPVLTKSLCSNALQWLNNFAITRWAQKTDVAACHLPHDVLRAGTSLDFILDHFHLLQAHQSLDTILLTWKYLQSDGDALFTLIEDLNHRFDHYIQQSKKNKSQKAALTRAKNKEDRLKTTNAQQPPTEPISQPLISRLVIRLPAHPAPLAISAPTNSHITVLSSPSSPRLALLPTSALNTLSSVWEPIPPRHGYQDLFAKQRFHDVGSRENIENIDPKCRKTSPSIGAIC